MLHDPKAVELADSIDYDAAKYGRGAGGARRAPQPPSPACMRGKVSVGP